MLPWECVHCEKWGPRGQEQGLNAELGKLGELLFRGEKQILTHTHTHTHTCMHSRPHTHARGSSGQGKLGVSGDGESQARFCRKSLHTWREAGKLSPKVRITHGLPHVAFLPVPSPVLGALHTQSTVPATVHAGTHCCW